MSGKQKILKFCLLLLLLFRKGKIVESTKFDGLAPQMELKLEKQNLKVFFFSHVFFKDESLDRKPFY
jgi:hypothetical protein